MTTKEYYVEYITTNQVKSLKYVIFSKQRLRYSSFVMVFKIRVFF